MLNRFVSPGMNVNVAIPGFKKPGPYPPGRKPTKKSKEQALVDSKIASEGYTRLGKKTMIGFFTLKNGHEIVTDYTFVTPEAFDEVIATEQCRKKASLKIWDLYNFEAQEERYKWDEEGVDTGIIPMGPMKTPSEIINEADARDLIETNLETASTLKAEDYTESSWNNLQETIKSAETYLTDIHATAEELYIINEAIVVAMTDLEPVSVDSGEASIMNLSSLDVGDIL